MGVINFNKLGYHIIKQEPVVKSNYAKEEIDLIIKMVNQGKLIEEIAEALDRNNREIGAKCGHLKKTGLIKFNPKSKANISIFGEDITRKMIEMFRMGLTSTEVAKILNRDAQSVAGKRSSLYKKGLVPISKKTILNRRSLANKQE